MRKFGVSVLSLLCVSSLVCGQGGTVNVSDFTKMTEVIPPSPNAASLTKFGGLNPTLFTGMMTTNIPLYTLSSVHIKVPIALDYSSAGVRVDEIPGRTGVNWNLSIGGVITRTVMGRLDDNAIRLKLPVTGTEPTNELITFLDAISTSDMNGGTGDSQPDIFSFNFNGYSGKFILDSSLNPVLLDYSNAKIEVSYSPTSQFLFKITVGDGSAYAFGGDSATEITSKVVTGNSCGKNVSVGVATAWYLTSIIHPNMDTVNFKYNQVGVDHKTGLSETMFALDHYPVANPCVFHSTNAPALPNTACLSWMHTSTAMLQQITSTSGASVKVKYVPRNDLTDMLISKIEIYQPQQTTPFRLFYFNYTNAYATSGLNSYSSADATLRYRPFLTSLLESSSDSSLTKPYSFAYNDMNSLPPRLSYGQDDYGLANGKPNTTLIPRPDDVVYQNELPSATANRKPDSVYGSKGLLTRIVYPTGGYDSIYYEPNDIYSSVVIQPPIVPMTLDTIITTAAGLAIKTSPIMTCSFGQHVRVNSYCDFNSAYGFQLDPIHDKTTVIVTEQGATIFSRTLEPGQTINEYVDMQVGYNYQIQITVSGGGVSGHGSFDYQPGSITYDVGNHMLSGMRVKRVASFPTLFSKPVVKRYIYRNFFALNQSSAVQTYSPVYQKMFNAFSSCQTGTALPYCTLGGPQGCVDEGFVPYSFFSIYSNSQTNIYAFSVVPTCYSNVREMVGEKGESGISDHKFLINGDALGSALMGQAIPGTPATSYAFINGKEVSQTQSKNVYGNFVPIQMTLTHYNQDSRVINDTKAFVVNKKYQPTFFHNPPQDVEMGAYDVGQYLLLREWVYPDTVTTYDYAPNGVDYVKSVNVVLYGNVTHAMPTRTIKSLSDGRTETVDSYYPGDLTLTGAPETARQALVARHIWTPVLKETVTRGTTQTYQLTKDYNLFANNQVLPRSSNVQTLANPLEKRVDFTRYNSAGLISEQYKTNDQKQIVFWDYLNRYVTGEVTNADSVDCAFSSFEADAKGNWVYTGTIIADPTSPTGSYCYNNASGITKSGLSSGTTYIVSYWKKSAGALTVTGSSSVKQGKTINGWSYFEHTVSGTTSVSISGAGYIDEVRLFPASAQMKTYTYVPEIGLSTTCDPDNRISYYGYDGLGRLSWIKDQDGNIVKTMEYHYQSQN